MAALSDPRAFMSAQEKRAQQMKAMGIEETDINIKDIKEGDDSGTAGKKGSKSGEKKEEKKGEFESCLVFPGFELIAYGIAELLQSYFVFY